MTSTGIQKHLKCTDLFFNPLIFFKSLKDSPYILLPVLIILAGSLLMNTVLFPYTFDLMKNKLPHLDVDLNNIKGLIYVTSSLFTLFQTLITLFIGALIVHVLSIVVKGNGTLRETTSVLLWAGMSGVLKAIFITVITTLMKVNGDAVIQGLMGHNKYLIAMLDPFVILNCFWVFIGVMTVHKINWIKALIIVIFLLAAKLLVV